MAKLFELVDAAFNEVAFLVFSSAERPVAAAVGFGRNNSNAALASAMMVRTMSAALPIDRILAADSPAVRQAHSIPAALTFVTMAELIEPPNISTC